MELHIRRIQLIYSIRVNLGTLKSDLIFLYKTINYCIDCFELLAMIHLKINDSELRYINLFCPKSATTFLNSNSLINRMLRLANKYEIDPLVNSLYAQKF